MDKIILTTPANCIPPTNTVAYHLLSLLADGKPHSKAEILSALEDDPRSARQALTGETYGYWLIHNIGIKKAVYQLDERHISGNQESDRNARAEAYKQLKDRSKRLCERETLRYPKALKEQVEANAMYQERLDLTEGKQLAPEY